MLKVVLDTNLLIQAAIGHAGEHPTFEAWLNGSVELMVSADLLIELADVLSRPMLRKRIAEAEATEFIQLIAERALYVTPHTRLILCRDPKDNFLLEIAADGNADYLITNDNDFLDDEILKQTMQERFGAVVVSPVEFSRILTK